MLGVITHAHSCIFIGASMGAILAFECATQLRQRGFSIERIISIDGGGQPYMMPNIKFEEHHTQMCALMARYAYNDDNEISEQMREAMIENAWQLLQMLQRYHPKRFIELGVSLLKVTGSEADDYGWHRIANTCIKQIPGTHENMLDEKNSPVVADIVAEIVNNLARF
ncbi:hypothetical protein Tcan_11672 [Toxocara canis]|nr:hypothetical protein Tcan_11672 [Toxocara canis]